MRHQHQAQAVRGSARIAPAVITLPTLLALVLAAPAAAGAQQNAAAQPAAEQAAASPQGDEAQGGEEPLTFLDSVTVTATLAPAPVMETPGTVTVIDDQEIQSRMFETFADLVKYEPGVYIENNVTRLGLNGFSIRGIGGNRVLTQIDGVQTSEQFDFGPFNVHQFAFDVDAIKSLEIVRNANSALYGSDALGGVVSLFTKDPEDYLRGRNFHAGGKMTWDGRANDTSGNVSLAGGGERLQGSLFVSGNRGGEIRNQGTVETLDDTRTVPNPQNVVGTQVLAKLVFTPAPGNMWRVATELYDSRVETEWYSDREMADLGFLRFATVDSDAVDTQDRRRYSLDHTLVGRGLDQVSWRVYGQRSDTSQVVDRQRMVFSFGPPTPSQRHGTVDHEQVGYGGSAQGQHWLGADNGVRLTFGASYKADRFDMLRDRSEVNALTGAPIPTRLIFPDKYYPESDVAETGSYLQAEVQVGRLTLVPGVRYDHYRMDADQSDPVFVATGKPVPADFSDGALSPKVGAAVRITDVVTVHAQYARGFRAPPHNDINTGFANPAGGYTTLPNPDLKAERSDNFDFGAAHGLRPRELRGDRVHEPLRPVHRADRPRLQPDLPPAGVPVPEPGAGGDSTAWSCAARHTSPTASWSAAATRASRASSSCRAPRSRRWRRKRRSNRSRPTRACSASATSSRRAAGAPSCRCGWSSRTRTRPTTAASTRRTRTRSSISLVTCRSWRIWRCGSACST